MPQARSLRELLTLEAPHIKQILAPNLLVAGGSMFVYGPAESLKSWLVLELEFAVASGARWLGLATEKGVALMYQSEQTEPMYRKRVIKFSHSMNDNLPMDNLYIRSEPAFRLDNPIGFKMLKADVEQIHPQLVIIDNLYQSMDSISDERCAKALIRGLSNLQHKNDCAIVVVHHTRKGQAGGEHQRLEDMAGMSDFNRWADTMIFVNVVKYTPGGRPEVVSLVFEKVKNAEEEEIHGITVRFDRGRARFSPH